ncbi:TPA: hypothetical protein J4O72_001190 [Escherichia coli]|nr:hypothetical protein [Escherichia coli]
MPNTSIHLSRCNILQNNKLQPAEIYKESQQTAKLEFFCDEFLNYLKVDTGYQPQQTA